MSLPPLALDFDDGADGFAWAFPDNEAVGEWTTALFAEGVESGVLTVPALGTVLTTVAVSSPWAFAHCMALVQWLREYRPPSSAPLDQVQGWLEAFYHACEAEVWELAGAIAQAHTKTGQPLYCQLGQWGHCREQVELCEAMIPHAAEPLRGKLRQLAGDGRRRLGHYAAARHHYEALLQEGHTNQESRQILKARLGLAHLDMAGAFYDRVIPQLVDLLPEAEALGDAALTVEVLQQLALAYGYTGRWGRSVELSQRALALVQTHGLDDLEVTTLQALTRVYEWRGQTHRAGPYLERILVVAKAQQNLALEADVYMGLSRASACKKGQVSKSVAYSEQSLALYRQIHYVDREAVVLNDIGVSYAYSLGQPATALTYFQQAESLSRSLGFLRILAITIANQAYCYALMGEHSLAHQMSQTALALAHQDGAIAEERMVAYAVLGRVHWVEGRYFQALALVWQALCMAPPWRSINGQMVLAKAWETLRQWPQHWWQAKFGGNQLPSHHN